MIPYCCFSGESSRISCCASRSLMTSAYTRTPATGGDVHVCACVCQANSAGCCVAMCCTHLGCRRVRRAPRCARAACSGCGCRRGAGGRRLCAATEGPPTAWRRQRPLPPQLYRPPVSEASPLGANYGCQCSFATSQAAHTGVCRAAEVGSACFRVEWNRITVAMSFECNI